ncbi:MAG: bacteriohemerythrin [Spirochaetaceae bacterium]|nr:bacteriohemerythrin [Spirochaetaceae bacterium]
MINNNDNKDMVIWGDKYAIGIQLIDDQHKELFALTNELFRACLGGEKMQDSIFKETMGRMVEYVRFHFGAEQELLQRIKYPDYPEHKKQHDTLVRNILETVKEYNEGKKLVPNQFARILRDWILSHIAIYDKLYAAYIVTQKKKGLLSDKDING